MKLDFDDLVDQCKEQNKDCNYPIGFNRLYNLIAESPGSDAKDLARLAQVFNGEMLMLGVSEAAEVLEADRKGVYNSNHLPGFSAEEEESADIIIREVARSSIRNLRLKEAILAKMEFNKTRDRSDRSF